MNIPRIVHTQQEAAQNQQFQQQQGVGEQLYLLVSRTFENLDINTFIEQMFQENAISYRFTDKIYQNSIMWLQAKTYYKKKEEDDDDKSTKPLMAQDMNMTNMTTSFENEFVLVYHNCYTFQKGLRDGSLHQQMRALKTFAKSKKSDFKVIVLFNSVSDSLYNNDDCEMRKTKKEGNVKDQKTENDYQMSAMGETAQVSKSEFDKFLIDLTIQYEFDYVEHFSPLECVDFLKEMHLSIEDKPHRKELSMYNRKGFKPGRKALMLGGFSDELSICYLSWLMCIPGLSENKAIGIAKVYPTIRDLMIALRDPQIPEKIRKQNLQDVEIAGAHIGDKSKKLGKAMAEKVYMYFVSIDPKIIIN